MVNCGTVALATAWIIFEPCLMMPACFGLAADHVAGRILQIDDRHVGLAAELDELRRLARPVGIDRSVVADQPDRVPLDFGLAADGVRTIAGLEIEIVGIVDDTGDDLAHIVGLAVIGRHRTPASSSAG